MYNCDRYAGANQALNFIIHDLVHNRFAFTVILETLCWFGCMSNLKYQKVLGEHHNTKAEKNKFEKNCPGFSIDDEIKRFKEVFNVSINLYKYSPDEKKYSKLRYYEKHDSQYLLNIALVPVENGEHPILLKKIDNALQSYVFSKCNLRVFHNYSSYKHHETYCDGSKLTKKLITSPTERSIDPNYDFNPRN
jgi:hypothetical protein